MPQAPHNHPTDSARIGEFLDRVYGLAGTLTRLPGESENYLATTPDGSRYILKLAGPDKPPDVLTLEHALTEALAAADIGVAVPRFVPTREGNVMGVWTAPGGPSLRGRVLEFVTGTPWHDQLPSTAAARAHAGESIARIANTLVPLRIPQSRRTHQWDVTRATLHWEKRALIADRARRRLLDRAFTRYAAGARPYLGALPHAVIHGDINDENLLMAGDRVCGLLDFGDALYAPVVCDLATALAYLTLDEPDPLQAGADVVASYHRVRPLSAPDLEVLFALMCGRLAMSVVIAAERRRIDPERASWFLTEPRAWHALERFADIDPLAATDRLASGTGVEVVGDRGSPRDVLLERRSARFSAALSLTYREPLKFFRGRGAYLVDGRGEPYLDLYNNVCHVGHCHPRVVAAGQQQLARLNTNTRYLYDQLVEYADRLCATLPPALECCFVVNSGSEANELALRLARTCTGHRDVVVLEHAYHGHTNTLIEISPYKFMGPGGSGRPAPWVHVAPIPDGYRGAHHGTGRAAGAAYGDAVGRLLADAARPPAAFIAESLPSVGGQIIPPDGYFETVFGHVRGAGGVCILDEVQVGFGRVGTHFWAFEQQGVVPDIVVLGKPIGNGHPLGAVITTRPIAEAFGRTGMEFFSTFGGNPVACAIGAAVLDVLREEGLQDHALRVGTALRDGLRSLRDRHALVGDVRGTGLFIGVELVRDRETLEPATEEAAALVNLLRDRRVLVGTDGPYENVVKIKPPMVVSDVDTAMAIDAFDDALGYL
jgi:4-aminobutyrate aminotransferase-like enzyme/Ser/Thr protein kinase RdoA (MazF antagonist)